MELTRRDAVAALAAAGVAGGVGAGAWLSGEDSSETAESGPDALTDEARDVLVAVARVVYPSEVSGIAEFVETYSRGRVERVRDDAYRRGVIDAAATVDGRARSWYGAAFADLDAADREAVLEGIGARAATPDPDGYDGARVRHYLVNEVLFALYAAPTGGELVGIENPQGHPGGLESYRRGPDE